MRRRKVLPKNLLQLLRIRISQLEQETDDTPVFGYVGFFRDNWHTGGARIFAGADDFDDVAVGSHERKPVHQKIDFDDFDRFLARHFFADEDVDFALDEIVHHQLLAGECLIEMQNVGDIAVWVLQADHVRRTGRRGRWRCGSSRGGNTSGDLGTSAGNGAKQEQGYAEKSQHVYYY